MKNTKILRFSRLLSGALFLDPLIRKKGGVNMSNKEELVLVAFGKPRVEELSSIEQNNFYLTLLNRIIEMKKESKGEK